MPKLWDAEQKEYIRRSGIDPRTNDQELTMNYCIAWCKAYGKTYDDWRDNGFNTHMYSQIKCSRKQKLLRLNIEAMETTRQ